MTAADPGDVLAALPDTLWPPLLSAVRTAADRLGKQQLPAVLQPYAGFTPAKLGQGRARKAVAAAVAGDARLREAIGQVLGEPLWGQSQVASPQALMQQFGTPAAAAALAARSRWDELHALAQEVAVPAPRAPRPPAPRADAGDRSALNALRRERDAALRGRTSAEQRASELAVRNEQLQDEVARLTAERDAGTQRSDAERARLRDRLARLQRQVSAAESQARSDRARVVRLAGELERLSAELLADPPAQDPGPTPVPAASPAPARLPRGVKAATPGRPCVLPPGVTDVQPAAVGALLAVPGIEVILDGYNVTKDMRGVPHADLVDQRAWLVRIAAAVGANRDVRVTVVFDGAGERTTSAAAARVVRCMFTAEGETADDRIVALVSELPADAPALVVTSDREVRSGVEQLGANVLASGVFLKAVG